MKRREFITLLGCAAATWPLAARAQQPERVRLIGVLTPYAAADPEGQARTSAFINTLQGLGWTDARNPRIEVRWFAGNVERAKADAAELVGLAPDVIVVGSNPGLAELRLLTRTIPVVFTQVSDPIDSGFVSGLARPGGHITGFQNFEPAIGGKWLGVLKEAVPNVRQVAVLLNPQTASNAAFLRAAQGVAPSLGVQITAAGVTDGAEIERAITMFASNADGGLVVAPHPIIVRHRRSIIELTARHRLPAVYPFRFLATEGGLMSYGIDQIEQWRGAAKYVDRILRGEKPGELPVQAPTKYEFVINLKTARTLGLQIPPSLLAVADEVIE